MTSHYDADADFLFSSIFSEIPYHRHMLTTVIIDGYVLLNYPILMQNRGWL